MTKLHFLRNVLDPWNQVACSDWRSFTSWLTHEVLDGRNDDGGWSLCWVLGKKVTHIVSVVSFLPRNKSKDPAMRVCDWISLMINMVCSKACPMAGQPLWKCHKQQQSIHHKLEVFLHNACAIIYCKCTKCLSSLKGLIQPARCFFLTYNVEARIRANTQNV